MFRPNLPDPKFFNFKDCVIAGDECVLVTPKMMGVEWTDENKYFRSSIWRKKDGYPISLGFRKFVNYGEKPDFEPFPENTAFNAVIKLDGSLIICSKHCGELIVRTRGTVDATQLDNGHEIEFLKKKYPKAFDNEWLKEENYSILFEWTTPTNRIVLQESEEPTLWLIGMVFHHDYSYVSQHKLDTYAKEMGVERPKSFGIDLTGDIELLKEQILPLKDIEGVVIYDHESEQILKKVKTLRYLELHRVFTGVKSVDHLFDLYVEYGEPNRENFEALLAVNFDWELVTTLSPLMDELYVRIQDIASNVLWVLTFLQDPDFYNLDRKSKAVRIVEAFPNYSWIAFSMLDGKKLDSRKLWETFKCQK